jgi:hypothetical protein
MKSIACLRGYLLLNADSLSKSFSDYLESKYPNVLPEIGMDIDKVSSLLKINNHLDYHLALKSIVERDERKYNFARGLFDENSQSSIYAKIYLCNEKDHLERCGKSKHLNDFYESVYNMLNFTDLPEFDRLKNKMQEMGFQRMNRAGGNVTKGSAVILTKKKKKLKKGDNDED